MTYFQTIILSLIEGFTEFLPISSTGHLILAQNILGITPTEFTKSFNIIIQLSAIFAVLILYQKKILGAYSLWFKTFIAFLPTGIIGLTLYQLVKNYFIDNLALTTAALFIGGLVLLLIDHTSKQKGGTRNIKCLQAPHLLLIGLFQSLSIIPGVSRSAASITGGLFVGLSRVEAVEFSFLLAIPTMAAATGYDLLKTGFTFTPHEYQLLLLGSLFSFIAALIAVKNLTSYVARHNFKIFAIYRILLALIIWLTLKP